ncbi:hypothetical protein CWI42_020800 [Ordospora colligata]|nr:hypothetical protein CWI40_020820 [Ordospora colligata]TBU19338.1 hypothetical protein CWI42_020800 [Ordospora colligata]
MKDMKDSIRLVEMVNEVTEEITKYYILKCFIDNNGMNFETLSSFDHGLINVILYGIPGESGKPKLIIKDAFVRILTNEKDEIKRNRNVESIAKIFKVLKSINEVDNTPDVITIEEVVNVMKDKRKEFALLVETLLSHKECHSVTKILICLDSKDAKEICNDIKDYHMAEVLNFIEDQLIKRILMQFDSERSADVLKHLNKPEKAAGILNLLEPAKVIDILDCMDKIFSR